MKRHGKRDGEGAFRSRIADAFGRLGRAFGRAVYPPDVTCDLCGAELVADTRYNLCARCLSEMPFTGERVCLCCGAPHTDEADYCLRCQRTDSVFRHNRSPLVYEGAAKQLILDLKFGKKKYIAKLLGAMMSDDYLSRGGDSEIIVFVPMTAKEKSARGFNQAELLAREVGARLDLPVLPALEKIKESLPQKELSAKERAENLKGCFSAAYGEYIKGRKILLVDDVFTTGATANECASVLLKNKVKEVCVLTAAVAKPAEKS